MKEKHLKLRLADAERKQYEAVWWSGVEQAVDLNLRPNSKLEIAYTPEANTWNGNTRLQLKIEDVREIG
jgi:hypothetical protein